MQGIWDRNKFLDFWEIYFLGILLSNKYKYFANFHSRPQINIFRTKFKRKHGYEKKYVYT